MSLTIKKAKELGIEFILGDEILYSPQQMGDSKIGVYGFTLEMCCQVRDINKANQCEELFNQTVKSFAWRSTPLPKLFNYTIERKGHQWRPTLEQECCDCGDNNLDELLSQVSEHNKHDYWWTVLPSAKDFKDGMKALAEAGINYKGEKEMTEDAYEAGTIEHCYEVLEGDLNNACNNLLKTNSIILYNYNGDEYYTADVFYGFSGWVKVCTIDEFNAYKAKKENPATKDKTIWTIEMKESGVPLEVGMTCMYGDMEVVVEYIGRNFSIIHNAERLDEGAVYTTNLSPIETRSPLELQQDQVLEFMHQNSQMTTVEIVQALQDNGFLKDV